MADLAALNDDGLRQVRDSHLQRLAGMFSGRHGPNVFVLCGVKGIGQSNLYTEPEKWIAEALDDLASRADAVRDPHVFRPLSINPWPYGVHFVDTLFGAHVYELQGEKENWQAEYLRRPVGELAVPDIEAHPSFRLARRLAEAFVEARVTVPFFAPPILSSPLNIALNLFGQEFLLAMLSEPDDARRDLRVITDTIRWLHAWFQEHVPFDQLQMIAPSGRMQPPGHGQICGCSTQMLSPEQYDEFVLPLDREILGQYTGGLIHLCGSHSQHIPTWRSMAELRAVQLNDRAAEDLALYFEGLRPDQMLYVNPCDGMPVNKIVDITGGQRTVIVGNVCEPMRVRTEMERKGGAIRQGLPPWGKRCEGCHAPGCRHRLPTGGTMPGVT